jgi:hypothetical protein
MLYIYIDYLMNTEQVQTHTQIRRLFINNKYFIRVQIKNILIMVVSVHLNLWVLFYFDVTCQYTIVN